MTTGMFLAVFSFICAALVQMEIDKTLPTFPSASQSQLRLLNMGSAPVTIKLSNNPLELSSAQTSDQYFTFEREVISVSVDSHGVTRPISLVMGERQTLLIPSNVNDEWLLTNDLLKSQNNNAVRFVNGLMMPVNVSHSVGNYWLINPQDFSNYSQIKNGMATFTIQNGLQSCKYNMEFGFGGSYTFFIAANFTFGPSCRDSIIVTEDIKPNSVHMALQFPQYFLITTGEVLFSVTGLEFSYSQAPSNMKAVLLASWLFTAAVGNLIVLTETETVKYPKQWMQYIFFASLLLVVTIIFSIMAYSYDYINATEIEAEFKKKVNDDKDDGLQPKKTKVNMVTDDSSVIKEMIEPQQLKCGVSQAD